MNLFTADVGGGRLHVYDSEKDVTYLKLDEIDLINLNIPNLKNGATLVIEDAHLRERVKDGYSLAHVFHIDQLRTLYENAKRKGITILLFPHKKSPVVRKLSGFDPEYRKSNHVFMKEYGISTDEADILSLANFLKNDPEAFKRLKKFKPITQEEYQKQNKHKFDFVKECNQDLNIARTQGYGFDNYYNYEDAVTRFINNQKYQLADRLSGDGIFDLNSDNKFTGEELMTAVGLNYSKTKSGKLNALKSESRLYTLIASILRPNGELRKRGFPPGHKYENKKMNVTWKWSKENYFGCKAFHERGGVASSNYKQHMRPGISEFEGKSLSIKAKNDEIKRFKIERSKADKKTQSIWYVLRKMIVEDGLR